MTTLAAASAFALSTTFTPPAICTENHFTMLERLDFRIFKNYPDPAGTTLTSCYPTQFLSSYFSQKAVQTPLPAIAPLVCPVGYDQVTTNAAGYLACCPSGFSLAAPSASSMAARPAYGATCYSDISSLLVTSYDNAGAVATSTWTAQSTGSQAYALVIEGFAKASSSRSASTTAAVTSGAPGTASTTGTGTGTSSGSSAGASTTSKSDGGNGGVIVSGVVGSVAGLVLLLALAL